MFVVRLKCAFLILKNSGVVAQVQCIKLVLITVLTVRVTGNDFSLAYRISYVFVLVLVILSCAYPVCYCLVVGSSAIDCLERLVSEMTYYVSSGTLNPTYSLTRIFIQLDWANYDPLMHCNQPVVFFLKLYSMLLTNILHIYCLNNIDYILCDTQLL